MIPENLTKLIQALIDKTNAKLATWGKTSRENEYKLVFESGAITTDSWIIDGNIEYVDFAIYNTYGDKIDEFMAEESNKDFPLLKSLHNVAKRRFYNVDETINGLFDEIKSTKSIGKRTIENSDDLPF